MILLFPTLGRPINRLKVLHPWISTSLSDLKLRIDMFSILFILPRHLRLCTFQRAKIQKKIQLRKNSEKNLI